jgi:hypothetical protein
MTLDELAPQLQRQPRHDFTSQRQTANPKRLILV